jgi:hypothetical protein
VEIVAKATMKVIENQPLETRRIDFFSRGADIQRPLVQRADIQRLWFYGTEAPKIYEFKMQETILKAPGEKFWIRWGIAEGDIPCPVMD